MLHALTAQIVFSGLIAFVPVAGDPTWYKILMPEASGDQFAADGCPLPRHVPWLIIAAESCTDGAAPCPGPDKRLEELGKFADDLKPIGVFQLEGKDVTITFTPPPLPAARIAAGTPSGTVPRDSKEARSSHWIPTMPRLEKVEPACLDPDIRQCPLAARAEIKGAPLETCHLVQLSKQPLCASRFKTARWSWLPWGRLAQAVADGTVMNFNLQEGTYATIKISDLKQMGGKDWKIVPRKESPNLVIWIIDEPLWVYDEKEMYGSGDPCTQHPEVGAHYQIFYNLAARDSKAMPVSPRDRPHPVEFMDCVMDDRQPYPDCPWFTKKERDKGGKYPFYHGNITHCGLMMFHNSYGK
jgi:hypothetical protein